MIPRLRALLVVLVILATTFSASGCGLLTFGAGAATGAVVEDEVDDDGKD